MKLVKPVGVVVLALALGACSHARVKNDSSEALYHEMESSNPPGERKAAAMEIGRRGSQEGKAVLVAHLSDPDPEVRIKVIHALAVEMFARDTAPAILPYIHDENPKVAKKAITALTHLEYTPAIPEFRKIVESGVNPEVLRAANSALVHFQRQGTM